MLKRLLSNLPSLLGVRSSSIEDTTPLEAARQRLGAGDVAGAWAACQVVRSQQGESADLLALEGGIFGVKGHYAEARPMLEAALRLDPDHAQANADLGNIALAEGKHEEAARLMDCALAQDSANPAILTNRGQVERACSRWPEAESFFSAALASDSGYVPAAEALFSVYDESEQYQKAMEFADRLLAADPEAGRWLRMRGFLLYKRLFEPTSADRVFDQAEKTGESNAAFWIDRGICARDLGDGERSAAYLDKALAIEPDNPLPVFHKGLLRLYQQRYAEGWDAYEIRLHDEHWLGAPLPAPRWPGGKLVGGTLLIMAEQGLGDEIMFASCLSDLPADVDIHADCAEKLLPIFRTSFPQIHFVPKGELPDVATACPDAQAIPIGSLPQLYRRTLDQFPRKPFLTASAEAREMAKQKMSALGGIKVGISWRGGTEITRKRLRSLPLSEVGKLSVLSGIEWINLQYGDCTEELNCLREQYGLHVHHWPEFLDPYEMTAALVQQLDLVISVDTTVVHLAGALGQRVWALVPHVPEWRYGFTTREMPWYAHVDILRQAVAGCWDEPIAELIDRLRK